jgi:hypothetical protein
MRKTALILISLVLVFAPAKGLFADTRDVLIALPQALKVGVGLGILARGLAVVGQADGATLAAGALAAAALSVPAGFVLVSALNGDGAGTARWRKISFIVDGSLALAAAGLGIYTLVAPNSDPEGWNKLVGSLFIAVSVPLGLYAAVDAVPYSFEAGSSPKAGGAALR